MEELDDRIAHRARIISDCRQIAANDDIRPEVLKEATRLAHGGTGDVKTEWFEDIFGKGLEKYEKLKEELMQEVRKQDSLLEEIRVSFHVVVVHHHNESSHLKLAWGGYHGQSQKNCEADPVCIGPKRVVLI